MHPCMHITQQLPQLSLIEWLIQVCSFVGAQCVLGNVLISDIGIWSLILFVSLSSQFFHVSALAD